MSIARRLKFIAKSYLNSLSEKGSDYLSSSDRSSLDQEPGATSDALEREIRRKVLEEMEREERLRREGRSDEADVEAELRKMQREAGSKPGSGGAGGAARHRLAQCYANLELKPGATQEEVKTSWRRLLLKYHPDRYPNDAAKQERATRISQIVNESYRALLEHLAAQKPRT